MQVGPGWSRLTRGSSRAQSSVSQVECVGSRAQAEYSTTIDRPVAVERSDRIRDTRVLTFCSCCR